MDGTKKMNRLIAVADIQEDKIELTYEYGDAKYVVQTPKTSLNQGMQQGEEVVIFLSVQPASEPMKYVPAREFIEDE